jgi:hypothetical protein
MIGNTEFRDWWGAYLRTAASPGAAVALTRMNSEADIRGVLPAIRVPTLVLHRTGDKCLLVDEGKYIADRIRGARFVELPGVDHLPFVGDQDGLLDEVEEFLTGVRHTPRRDPVLATVLSASFDMAFPDVRACDLQVRSRLRDHIDQELVCSRGREFGFQSGKLLASFDGPARAIRTACAIAHHAAGMGVRMKAGLQVGQCDIATTRICGDAVDQACQIESSAAAGEIVVSATIRDLVSGSGIRFRSKGPLHGTGLLLLSVDHHTR